MVKFHLSKKVRSIVLVMLILGSIVLLFSQILLSGLVPDYEYSQVTSIRVPSLAPNQYDAESLYNMVRKLRGYRTLFGRCTCADRVEHLAYTIIISYQDNTSETLYITDPHYGNSSPMVFVTLPATAGYESHHPPVIISYNTRILEYLRECSETNTAN